MIATLSIASTDPQRRVQLVEFKYQTDYGTVSDYAEATNDITESSVTVTEDGVTLTEPQTSPYSLAVTYSAVATIWRRITYLGTDGNTVVSERSFSYPRQQYNYVIESGVIVYESGLPVYEPI